MADVYDIEYTISLTEYSSVVSVPSNPWVYTVTDPCLAPTLTVPAQTDPDEYYYTANTPIADFTVADFTITPSTCSKTYTCTTEDGPGGGGGFDDLCTINSGTTLGSFDPLTRIW